LKLTAGIRRAARFPTRARADAHEPDLGRRQAAYGRRAGAGQFIKAGKLRCIATGTTQRLPQIARRPTVAEPGLPGFEMTQW